MPYVLEKACQQKTKAGEYINSLPGDPVDDPENWPNKQIWINSGHIRRVTQNEMDAITADIEQINMAAEKAELTKKKAEKVGRVSKVRVPSPADLLAQRLAALAKPH